MIYLTILRPGGYSIFGEDVPLASLQYFRPKNIDDFPPFFPDLTTNLKTLFQA